MSIQDANEPQSLKSSSPFGPKEFLTLLGIIIAGVAAFVKLQTQVSQLDPTKVRSAQEEAIAAIKLQAAATDIPVGTVIASVVKPQKFKELYGDKWALADGRTIIGSRLAEAIQKGVIPDLGGQFLRGINTKYGVIPETQDPDGTREPGTVQSDDIKLHAHGVGSTSNKNRGGGSGKNEGWNEYAKPLENSDAAFYTNATGGKETRPRNVAVYFYIKLN